MAEILKDLRQKDRMFHISGRVPEVGGNFPSGYVKQVLLGSFAPRLFRKRI